MRHPGWTIVIPVKGTRDAKSRLIAAPGIARAIALDTVEAATGAGQVIVVTSGAGATDFVAVGATVVADPGGGLNPAVLAGLAASGDGNVAVLLGDLPALTTAELAEALTEAESLGLALVPDADATGSAMIAATAGLAHHPAFGIDSRAKHLALGYRELQLPATSGLRRDVDTAAQLASIPPALLGRRTRVIVELAGKAGD